MKTLRIATWNVDYAPRSKIPALRREMAKLKADIWVLTETHLDLSPSVRHRATTARRARSDQTRPGSYWVIIWSNMPRERNLACGLLDEERTVAATYRLRRNSEERRSVCIYGTVMPWRSDRREHGAMLLSKQAAEWKRLGRYPQIPLFLAGDWNIDFPNGRYVAPRGQLAVVDEGLSAAGLVCATRDLAVRPGGMPCIDHIAVSAHNVKIQRSNELVFPHLSTHSLSYIDVQIA